MPVQQIYCDLALSNYPEMGGNALNYPLQRVFNIGINANL